MGFGFERGFYSNFRGLTESLPIPFPRFFTPLKLTEKGLLRQLSHDEKSENPSKKPVDEFLISIPSLVKLT
jgi:hypothetical protein